MPSLAPFELHRATSVAEASSLVAELGDESTIYSGGTELLLLMKLGFAEFGHLVDVKPIEELQGLMVTDGKLVIGGAVTHRTIERSELVRAGWPELAEMERGVANVRVRTTGSLGGNLAFADPHSDPATFLLAAGAKVRLGRDDERHSITLDEFLLGPYETAREPDELLCAIEIPAMPSGAAMSHHRFAFHERPAATVSAWVHVEDGAIVDARAAVGSVGVVPAIVPGTAAKLRGQDARSLDDGVLAEIAADGVDASAPVSDSNGAADYKAALVRTMVMRALREAAERATAREAS